MKRLSACSALFLLLLLTACKIAYGPVIQNSSSILVEVWADYSNGEKSYIRLEPGNGLWKGKPDYVPIRIITLQSGVRREFDQAQLQNLFAGIANVRDTVVLIDGATLQVMPISEAKRRKLM